VKRPAAPARVSTWSETPGTAPFESSVQTRGDTAAFCQSETDDQTERLVHGAQFAGIEASG
jgi:hypothetical protein